MKTLTAIALVVLASAALPAPTHAGTLRCRDTLHGTTCDGDRGYELRCRDTLHGNTCDDNRGRTTTCRRTLHGTTCEEDKR